jgi:hydroxyacylglutathione hydrolase
MILEQIYTNCLAQATYYLESEGESALFDPLRENQNYFEKLKTNKAELKYVFETHFHADFVSGHVEISQKSGAQIVFGPNAKPNYNAVIAEDNQIFQVGKVKVKVIHTPGHTLESVCYLITDETNNEVALITGDTLFIGDVGRPDLAQGFSEDLTQEKLAGMLFDSLRTKIIPLADDILVYPAHGAGSACGKNMSKETFDTLGNQKKNNYALRADMTKDEFVAELLDGLQMPPAYFPQNVMLNSKGYNHLDVIIKKSLKTLTVKDFKEIINQKPEVVILDVRHETDFINGHIPNSIFVGLHGQFAPWVGAVLKDINTPLLLITPTGKEEETITRLSRIGFDNVQGFLDGGIQSWKNANEDLSTIVSVTPEQFKEDFQNKKIVDVRKPGEYEAEHLLEAQRISLDEIFENKENLPQEPYYVHCAGGYRSVIFISLTNKFGNGFGINVEKGFSGIKAVGINTSAFVCQSKS